MQDDQGEIVDWCGNNQYNYLKLNVRSIMLKIDPASSTICPLFSYYLMYLIVWMYKNTNKIYKLKRKPKYRP